jgi:hypothetical protein
MSAFRPTEVYEDQARRILALPERERRRAVTRLLANRDRLAAELASARAAARLALEHRERREREAVS